MLPRVLRAFSTSAPLNPNRAQPSPLTVPRPLPDADLHDDPLAADPKRIFPQGRYEEHISAMDGPRKPLVDEKMTITRQKIPLGKFYPYTSSECFVAPSASLIGEVSVLDRASVWYGAVVRGDLNSVNIGGYSAVLDGAVVSTVEHLASGLDPRTTIGNFSIVGSNSVISGGATVHSLSYVGMKAIVGEGAVVSPQSLLAAGSYLPPGAVVPSGQVWGGNPIGFIRTLGGNEKAYFQRYALMYWALARDHMEQFLPDNIAHYEKLKLDRLEAQERQEAFLELQATKEHQDRLLRDKLLSLRKDLQATGALGEAH